MKIRESIHSSAINYLVMLSLFLLSACSTSINNPEINFVEPGIKATLALTLDAYLESNIEDTSPGMAILVIKDGEVTYENAKGMANKHTGLSITSDTGFRLGSISKTFTAIAIMQLYEQQLLTLEESIITLLPELPSSWQGITIHHLLSHQSGIPDYLNDLGIDSWPDGVTNQDVLEYFSSNDGLEFEPGTKGEYSNTGYLLLAEIVSRLSSVSFADYMENNLFQPLGMNNSYIADEYSVHRPNDALNYAEFNTYFGLNFYTTGAQAQVSSLNDMHLFINALLQGEIVTKDTFNLMIQSHTVGLFEGTTNFGYGFVINPNNTNDIGHGGGFDSFITYMALRNDASWQMVILSNGGAQTGNHGYLTDLVDQFYSSPIQ